MVSDEEHNHTDRFEELCAGYVLNALSAEERLEFESMLAGANEAQKQLYLELRSSANQLAFSMERGEPAEAVKQKLLSSIHSSPPSGTTVESEADDSKSYFAVAASFVLLVISLSLLFYAFNLSRELGNKNQIIEKQKTQLTSLQHELRQKEELLSILESREVDMVLMSGMEASPNGYGKIIWDPERDMALLQVSNLPAIPPDKVYQLWIIKNNQPVSAGLFSINDPNKDAFFKIEQMAPGNNDQSTNAFAVTLEPKGGMPQPTGDMYLMGNMKK